VACLLRLLYHLPLKSQSLISKNIEIRWQCMVDYCSCFAYTILADTIWCLTAQASFVHLNRRTLLNTCTLLYRCTLLYTCTPVNTCTLMNVCTLLYIRTLEHLYTERLYTEHMYTEYLSCNRFASAYDLHLQPFCICTRIVITTKLHLHTICICN